jgi:Leucine-rich repeat (LRR) protein
MDLSHNQITTIDDKFTAIFGHLVQLNLEANQIEQIPTVVLQLSKLSSLNLSQVHF